MSVVSANAEGDRILHPSSDLIRPELQRVLRSDHFNKSKRCQTLLSYVVEETLAGRSDQLKERLIGVTVFGRSPSYNTAEDPVVRNAAIEVRKRLAQFYVESAHTTAVRIDLHAGNYIPEFRFQEKAQPQEEREHTFPIAEKVESAPAAEEIERTASALLPKQPKKSFGPPRRLIISLIVAAGIVLGAGIAIARHWPSFGTNLFRLPESPPRDPATPTTLPGAAAVDSDVRILAGSPLPGPYIDRFGNQWSSDRYFTGGESKTGLTSFYFPPADPVLFRTVRDGAFAYDIPIKPNQVYELRLYFVETQYRYGNKAAGDGENIRLFQVRANDQIILDNFDIISDSGFASTTVRAFKNMSAASDGKLHLQFVSQQHNPILSAIELIPSTRDSIPPIRIHMAQSQVTDHLGNRWSSDNFYIGGQLFDSGAAVTGTPDPDLFNVAREGNFSYAIPVPPGRYRLTLYFAETWFHTPGQRVFDVACNGVSLFHGLDIFQQAGFSHVLEKTFHGLEANGQGKLLISFTPTINYASVRAIEVREE